MFPKNFFVMMQYLILFIKKHYRLHFSKKMRFFSDEFRVCQDLCVNFFKSISPEGEIVFLAQVVANSIREKNGELK
ncbi:hypothetical protein ERICIV_02157 [Paenibacillus larvae subsp. larvae]|uniref:Uncharacterized protein n=1 Tax=Paenibacillus larvae subsp. larvae TaxID=147375 RepID=A0A2L1U037_9BACL|nr:hypothetical protein ERICIII_02136 [Paenibacillus larvae subsp. larvae]AVF31074.1 hypothetical protein ERICIV_02157 [Paenibacillus larvae subsp. larvae]